MTFDVCGGKFDCAFLAVLVVVVAVIGMAWVLKV